MATTSEGHDGRQSGTPTARNILSAVLILLLVVFVLQNLEEVRIDFLVFTVETSMLVAMLICALLGAAAALLFTRQRTKA